MFVASWLMGASEFAKAEHIRRNVFVEEHGIPAEAEFDGLDAYAAHVYVELQTGEPIATGRMYPDGDILTLGRIAVMKEFRAQAYADLVLRLLLFRCQELPQTYIKLIVPDGMENDFAYTRFGFKAQGDAFSERGVMSRTLFLRRDSVIWDSDCKHEH